MEKVTGIGALFFRADDPKASGSTVFDPQPETSDLFGDAHKVWMVNFRVRDLDKMAAHLRAVGIKVDPQSYPNGWFANLHDPEGNPIQLSQPKGTRRSTLRLLNRSGRFWIAAGVRATSTHCCLSLGGENSIAVFRI